MKKFKLKRLASLMMAGVMAVTLSSCANKNNSGANTLENSSIVEIQDNEDLITDVQKFKIYDWKPIAVDIEETEMRNGEVGYIIPNNYYPYSIDSKKPIPEIFEILETNKEYQIISGAKYSKPDGTSYYRGFNGAVAIYKPYYDILKLKETNEEKFNKTLEELKAKYGEDSTQYKMFADVDNIKKIATDVYYSNLKNKISIVDMQKFKIYDWKPIAVDIEETEMENGEVGFIIPNDYYPYPINTVRPIAQNARILEENPEYTIFGVTKVFYPDGTAGCRDFSGCVAIYEPYFNILKLKELNNLVFEKNMEDVRIFYGEDSLEYKTFLEADNIKEIATDVYYNTLNKLTLTKDF